MHHQQGHLEKACSTKLEGGISWHWSQGYTHDGCPEARKIKDGSGLLHEGRVYVCVWGGVILQCTGQYHNKNYLVQSMHGTEVEKLWLMSVKGVNKQ